VRHAFRTLVRQPGFTAAPLITLALGIGANTAIFGVVNAVLLRPLPYRTPGRVVMLWSHWTNWNKTWVSQAELDDYQHQLPSLVDVGGFQYTSFNLTSSGPAERVRAATVQPAVFAALGVTPIVGRLFHEEEDRPGNEHVVVLNESLWRDRFGADPQIVGRTISLDLTPYTVVGVLPSAVRLPIDFGTRSATLLWVPIALGAPDPTDRGNHGYYAIGRLRDGASLAHAQAEVDTLTSRFQKIYPDYYDGAFGVTLVTATDEVFGDIRPALLLLLGAVGAVLLIACANVANLLLASSEGRQKELAIRAALGAGRFRIVRQLVTEALMLSAAGAAAGVAVAFGLIRLLTSIDPLKIPRVHDVAIDVRVLAFAAAVAIATGIIFGIVPALHAAQTDLQPVLRQGGRDSRMTTGWLRNTLVVVEIAGSVVLVAAALLLARSFTRLLRVDAGFNPSHVLTFRTSLPAASYATGASMATAYQKVAQQLRDGPGVVAAGAVTGLPLTSTRGDWGIRIEGRPVEPRTSAADWQVVTPGYFEALGTPLREGRLFSDADRADTLRVIVINEAMARTFWPGESPVGRRLVMGGDKNWITVVGVVANVRHRGLDADARSEMYRPHTQFRYGGPEPNGVPTMTWVVRTVGEPSAAIGYARQAVSRVDPDLGVSDVQTMDDVVADATSDRRLNTMLFTMLGGLALALAMVGVYGVVAYSVAHRTHEIGVRMAMGARARDVERLVIAHGGRLAAIGIALGIPLALAGGRLIRGLLFRVNDNDPAVLASVAAMLMIVALAASYIPARRATRVDPMIALRGE